MSNADVCIRKHVYQDRNEAKRAGQKSGQFGLPLKPYRCGVCDLWHLTSGNATADTKRFWRRLERRRAKQ